MLTFLSALLFLGGIVAGCFNNVLGISLPICAVLIVVSDLVAGSLTRIESRLDDQVDATYDQTNRKAKQEP